MPKIMEVGWQQTGALKHDGTDGTVKYGFEGGRVLTGGEGRSAQTGEVISNIGHDGTDGTEEQVIAALGATGQHDWIEGGCIIIHPSIHVYLHK